ncbi:MAG: MBL fold metallo-hydrolase [Desulfobacula sp.]|jgi:hydroxyacylglutathione hydrolase|nr:MBL fold metallo-hydrolase [Desulfobacula sp.]
MQMTEIMEGLFFIERGWLSANHFVQVSKEPILIDTAYKADADVTMAQMAKLGVRPSDVSLIINTHTHCDHIGANHIIQEQSGCDIALHTVGRHFIDTRDAWATWWRYYNQEADFFKCTRSLEDGDILNIGPHEFQVIYTPGHASDGIVLYNHGQKLLISSDTLWENDMAVMTLRVEGSLALFSARKSLEKIASLDIRQIYPGHGEPFTDVETALSKAMKKIDQYMGDRERIGKDLIKKIIIYTLLMKKSINEQDLFPYLMATAWFKETVDLYFNKEYEIIYQQIMEGFIRNKVVRIENNRLFTLIKP